MNMKLKKLLNDIQKTEDKIAELQEHLKRQNTLRQQMEDIEIIKSFRSMKLDSRSLLVLLDGIQKGTVTIQMDEDGGITVEDANPPAEETTTQVVEETATESTEDTEKKEDTGRVTGEGDNSAFSTPGNAQLVDDKENDDTKQFLTIQTKKGNTFYMVIDRSSNTENVYMMSLVDENDLAEFLDETEKSKETEESTVVIPETTPETTPVAEEETEVKKEEKTGMNVKGLGAIVLAAILGVAGIAVYKKHGRGKEDDYVSEQLEFSDGPYVNEEEDEEEE